MSLIPELTKDCDRDDCRVIGGNASVSTCMAWTPVYDKQGNRIDDGDPNTSTTTYDCATCGAHWTVSTQFGETKITKRNRVSTR